MTNFSIITENDISKWDDTTGKLYHFPKRYEELLKEGTVVIYYKGALKDKSFMKDRLSKLPHYFGMAKVKEVYSDSKSSKGDLFAKLEEFQPFDIPILAKRDGQFIENIPSNRSSNYWRDGVRKVSEDIYNKILASVYREQQAIIKKEKEVMLESYDEALTSGVEGKKNFYYTTRYERDKSLTKKAKGIHGTNCVICGFSFGQFYGPYAEGLIQIHHLVPLSTFEKAKKVNPETDLVPVCANCHIVIHKKKKNTLSIEKMKQFILEAKKQKK